MNKFKKLAACTMAVIACFSAVGTGAYADRPVSALTIIASIKEISASKDVIAIGESIQLELTWSTGAEQEVTFTSSNTDVAVVDSSGTVTGISSGVTVITAQTSQGTDKTLEITVSADEIPSVCYNTSELVLGQKLRKNDILKYDGKNIGSAANFVNDKGGYNLIHISGTKDDSYILPYDVEIVGIDGLALYCAPELDNVTYLDARTLSAGDVIDTTTHLLCYDYVINGRVLPVFLPEYYSKYIGDYTIKVKSIDHDEKHIELESVRETTCSGDVNGDGGFTVADVVMVQNWLLGGYESKLNLWEEADFCPDGVIDVFDLCIMKKELVAVMPPIMTIDDVVEIAKKGDELTWADLSGYYYEDIGSGRTILKFPVSRELFNSEAREKDAGLTMVADYNLTPETKLEPDDIYFFANDESIAISSEEFSRFIELYDFFKYAPENDETNQANAKKICDYALNEYKNGAYPTDVIYKEDIADDEISELWDENVFCYLSFFDEHTAKLILNRGLFDVYGYIVTDGTVSFELGRNQIEGLGYDNDIIDIEWQGDNIYYFTAGT